MIPQMRLTPLVVGLAITLAAVIVTLIAWRISTAGRDATAARVESAMAGAHARSAQAAGQVVDQAHAGATQSETLSRETADVIEAAPGADLRLDPELNRVARERLCLRPGYRDRPECVQLAGARQP